MIPAVKARCLKDIDLKTSAYNVIAIDEGQFFEDVDLPYFQIVQYSEKWANQGKIIVIAALDATFERKPFGHVCDLVAKAESVQKLSAVCLECGGWAYFTLKLDLGSKMINDIGGIEKYHPVCRKCYNTRMQD